MESPSPEVYKNRWLWHSGTWASGGLGRAGLTAGADHFRDLPQPKQFYDSVLESHKLSQQEAPKLSPHPQTKSTGVQAGQIHVYIVVVLNIHSEILKQIVTWHL